MSIVNFVRFIVTADEDWRITVTRDGQPVGEPRQLTKQSSSSRTWPLPPADEHAALAAAGINLKPAELEKIQERIAGRVNNKGEVGVLGKYLFHTLLGTALWRAILDHAGASPGLELALKFPLAKKATEDLGRFHWEALCNLEGFLARGVRTNGNFVRVAVTRIVSGSTVVPRPMNLPPRMLFVVGCDLNDPRIRAGTEFLGLLRQVRHHAHNRTFHPRVLQGASAGLVKSAVADFQPDLVHIICHGNDDGRLEFAPEPADPPGTPPRLLSLDDICDLFQKPDAEGKIWPPGIVVLSACNSGVTLGADQTAPLAARLIQSGVPVVVGMAGRIADLACRLFTRNFGEALCAGRSLIEATELGRRGAFLTNEPADSSCDWALPTLFMAEQGVGADFKPTDVQLSAREERTHSITIAFRGIHGRNEPCLAARLRELERASSGLYSGRIGFIALIGDKQHGRSRLMQEMVEMAVRDGHLPVLVSEYYRTGESMDGKPKDLSSFIGALTSALTNTSNFYKVRDASPELFQTKYLEQSNEPAFYDRLKLDVALALADRKATPKALVHALRHDLERLLIAARQAQDSPVNEKGRPVLFLDDFESLNPEVQRELLTGAVQLIGENGLGDPGGERIPLVVAFRKRNETQEIYEKTLLNMNAEWTRKIVLAEFDSQQDEDVLAYQQILLHPQAENAIYPGISDKRWVVSKNVSDESRQIWIGKLRKRLRRIPADFKCDKLYHWVEDAADPGVKILEEGKDDDVLRNLIGER